MNEAAKPIHVPRYSASRADTRPHFYGPTLRHRSQSSCAISIPDLAKCLSRSSHSLNFAVRSSFDPTRPNNLPRTTIHPLPFSILYHPYTGRPDRRCTRVERDGQLPTFAPEEQLFYNEPDWLEPRYFERQVQGFGDHSRRGHVFPHSLFESKGNEFANQWKQTAPFARD